MQKTFNIQSKQDIKKSSYPGFNQARQSSSFQPFIQPKLTINPPKDIFEQEADAVAERVMQMNSNDAVQGEFFSPSVITIQRKCAHCEEEEREMQRKELNDEETTVDHELEKYVDNLDSKGQSLPGDVRDFYEPRIGYDFSKVKIHTDTIAAKSAQSINALAYTSGNNIVFNSGQYSPDSTSGKKLLAHELTHVVQQSSSIQPASIQRMTIGTGTPPSGWYGLDIRVIPDDETERVSRAIEIVRNVVDNPGNYDDCLRAFNEHCPGDSQTAFADAFNNAVLWRIDDSGAYARGRVDGHDIAYTLLGYEQGEVHLAGTLMHEMGHNCGITGGEDHHFAALIARTCSTRIESRRQEAERQDELGLSAGIGLNSLNIGLVFAYRRLFDLALHGRLQLTLGADIDVVGLAMSIMDATGSVRGNLPEFEFGSLRAGLRERLGLWGGSNFGGIILGQEVGLDVGRFRVIRATGPEEFEYGPGFIVQITLGAEFYLPFLSSEFPYSVEAGYRFIRPLNPQAESLHQLIFGFRAPL